MELEVRINGVVESLEVAANDSLLTLLHRERYCSVRQGCETGECGSCTVLVDGVPRLSCVMLAMQVSGCTLTTTEGLAPAKQLHPLQQAFVEVGAVQCGFCTSGMLLSAYALLKSNPHPTEEEVRDALSGNLCRCTGYIKPIEAVLRAAAFLRGETVPPLNYEIVKADEDKTGERASDEHQSGSSPVRKSTSAKLKAATAAGATGLDAKVRAMASNPEAGIASDLSTSMVGQALPTIDAVKRVKGKASFVGDVEPAGLLYGRILTSPHPHASIVHIDVSQARALPGVHAVVTYSDIRRVPFSSIEYAPGRVGPLDQYSLESVVRYVGDRVAVVAAETPELAEQALGLIDVEYEVRPAIISPRKALEADAPRLHANAKARGTYDPEHNSVTRVLSELGNVEQGFAEADLIVEGEYSVGLLQQASIENHVAITYFDENDDLVVRTSVQFPYHLRRVLASLLDIPARSIRVERLESGGQGRARREIVLEDLCALLTVKTGRPVRLEYSRSDELRSGHSGQQHTVLLKTGVKRDGTIVANQMALLAGTGGYATHPLMRYKQGSLGSLALYPAPNLRFAAEVVYTSLPPSSTAEEYEMLPEFFALESHMDEIAKQLGIDALALRRKNWLRVGSEYPLATTDQDSQPRVYVESSGLPECLRVVEERIRWREKRGTVSNARMRTGVGIALSMYGSADEQSDTAGAIIKLNDDGSFDLVVSLNENDSNLNTLLVQIAAETLGVQVKDLVLHTSETSFTPFSTGSSSTDPLYVTGGAVRKAAEQVHLQILTSAARMLNVARETLKIEDGTISGPNRQSLTLAQIAEYVLYVEHRHLIATASWRAPQVPFSFAAHGVEVEVDTETGVVHVVKVVSAVDTGNPINPLVLEGQIHGSIALALGATTSEEMVYDQKGTLLTTDLRNYHIYNALDMPTIETCLVETHTTASPFGVKTVAEVALTGVAPALANAVANALKVRISHLPVSPERILRTMLARK